MTWNIMRGGRDGMDRTRLRRIADTVNEQVPDVLMIQEANDFHGDGNLHLHRFEHEVGMRGFVAAAETGYHLATFVRASLDVIASHAETAGFHHALLAVSVKVPDLTCVIVNTHLCPHSPELRVAEVRNILRFAGLGQEAVIGGDLNSLDHHADHSDWLAGLAKHHQLRFAMASDPTSVNTDVTRMLEAAGLVDLAAARATLTADLSTVPTDISDPLLSMSKVRLDYIFATRRIADRLVNASVLRSETTNGASDHFPLVADFSTQVTTQDGTTLTT